MTAYAKGTHAYGYCDYCAFRFPLADLKYEVENAVLTKRRACPECWSPDHPQNRLGRLRIWDPQSLFDPRPDTSLDQSRGYFGWNPTGHELIFLTISVGDVSVSEA